MLNTSIYWWAKQLGLCPPGAYSLSRSDKWVTLPFDPWLVRCYGGRERETESGKLATDPSFPCELEFLYTSWVFCFALFLHLPVGFLFFSSKPARWRAWHSARDNPCGICLPTALFGWRGIWESGVRNLEPEVTPRDSGDPLQWPSLVGNVTSYKTRVVPAGPFGFLCWPQLVSSYLKSSFKLDFLFSE